VCVCVCVGSLLYLRESLVALYVYIVLQSVG